MGFDAAGVTVANVCACGAVIPLREREYGNAAWQALSPPPPVPPSTCSTCLRRQQADRAFETLCRKYGLTVAQYWYMFEAQDRVCCICLRPPVEGQRLDIDHDHATGHMRGLLCSDCNTGLGFFRDNREALARAIEYLRQHD